MVTLGGRDGSHSLASRLQQIYTQAAQCNEHRKVNIRKSRALIPSVSKTVMHLELIFP